MSVDAWRDELRSELAEVEKGLADLRRNAAQIRAGLGDAEDPADRGALIYEADEQDSQADQLAARREALLGRLADA
jgi:hypothetical protein